MNVEVEGMDPLVIELRRLYARVRKIERRIIRDDSLCAVVRQSAQQIRSVLNTDQRLQGV